MSTSSGHPHSPASSPSASSSPSVESHTSSATSLALGISLAVVGSLVLGGLAFYFIRRHLRSKKAQERGQKISSHRRTYMVSVDPSHLAARVTPFGVGVNAPDVEVPKFVHTPGENMRVAYRRSDGGWSFHEGMHHANHANQASGSGDLQRNETMSTIFTRSKEKQLRPGELTTRGYIDLDLEGNPPPAYHYDESAYGGDGTSNSHSHAACQ
ncbi:hypothetical protein GSI_08332 [Ganoderma sinense ZZ0214-1]|uniref:Uncharacterized protein n=1 Tax=Ganoderma sinense ZZ0214-1 TaxID=1077348 RepID=A0A2G8S706_9APHY|nr:hypothetical protein GSI_08332 [Ganoderma sinense ZZ0214-1]